MKNLDIRLTILANLLLICIPLLSGCEDTKPSAWDVGEGTTWEVWAEGNIVSITEVPASSYWEYAFSTGKTIDIRHIKDPGTVNIGQQGILYRNMSLATDDKDAWFQWINEETVIKKEYPKFDMNKLTDAQKAKLNEMEVRFRKKKALQEQRNSNVQVQSKITTIKVIEPNKEEPIEIIKYD